MTNYDTSDLAGGRGSGPLPGVDLALWLNMALLLGALALVGLVVLGAAALL